MRRRRPRPEEPVHSDRWLVSYADFVTLLFALFVVLFASSYRDKKTIQTVSAAVRNGFIQMGSMPGTGSSRPKIDPSKQLDILHSTGGIDLMELNRKLSKALGKEIERKEIDTKVTPEGFVISLHELGFFDSGQAQLKAGATEKLKTIATLLAQYGLEMRIEGHSDDVPIHNAIFNSNWELSTGRATAVATMLITEASVDPAKMSIAGYGQYRPVASNDTPQGRSANRRVDIVVVSSNAKPVVQAIQSTIP